MTNIFSSFHWAVLTCSLQVIFLPRCESSSDESDSAVAVMTPAQKRRQQLAAMAEKRQKADQRRRGRLAFSESEEEEERPLDDRENEDFYVLKLFVKFRELSSN